MVVNRGALAGVDGPVVCIGQPLVQVGFDGVADRSPGGLAVFPVQNQQLPS